MIRWRVTGRLVLVVLVSSCALVAALGCFGPVVPEPTPTPSPDPVPTLDVLPPPHVPSGAEFGFEDVDIQLSPTLTAAVQELDRATGRVLINGVDTAEPSTPFTFVWGDGRDDEGWFPMTHIYADTTRDYEAMVVAHYLSGRIGQEVVPVSFGSPPLHQISTPVELRVTIPTSLVALTSRIYGTPTGLSTFSDGFFTSATRATVEYILSIAAWIQCEFANDDVYAPDGIFQQVVLRDSDFEGMYSMWFTTPPSYAAGDYAFRGRPEYSSLFHEMGHNFTLNSPARFCFGGRIDGPANAIFSETMAQIFAHATAYEIINCQDAYGLDPTTTAAVWHSAVASYQFLKSRYNAYVDSGCGFSSWNNPATTEDETFDTFMTLAYVFCERAELARQGYREPLQRMMKLLQTFDSSMLAGYSPGENSPEAEAYRATLMVAALSYAFDEDLRARFVGLRYPVSDEVYASLLDRVR